MTEITTALTARTRLTVVSINASLQCCAIFVHTIIKAKQYAGLGRAEPGIEPGLEPGRWIFQPGHLV